MYAYQINAEGYIIDNYVIVGDVDVPEGCITTQLPQPLLFHKTKWSGAAWIEGETEGEKAEREAQHSIESLKPGLSEIAKAERELEIIELLIEMGLI